MGLTDEHIVVMRCALDAGGRICGDKADPSLEAILDGMISMGLFERAWLCPDRRHQCYLVTRAGKAAYEAICTPTPQ